MAWWEYLRERLRPATAAVDFNRWKAVMTQTRRLLASGDLRGVIDLVHRHRRSNTFVIGIAAQLATGMYRILAQPEDAAKKEVAALMKALRNTSVVKVNGRDLSRVPPNDNPVYGVLAMHTLLLDALLERNPEIRSPQPSKGEIDAAIRLVERQFRPEIMRELCRLAATGHSPSFYIARMYNWDVDCDRVAYMRTQTCGARTAEMIRQIGIGMEKEAEAILERDPTICLPQSYTEKLDAEHQTLLWLRRFPQHLGNPHVDRRLLEKYEIDPRWPHDMRLAHLEEALDDLNRRLERLAGKQVAAEKLPAVMPTAAPRSELPPIRRLEHPASSESAGARCKMKR